MFGCQVTLVLRVLCVYRVQLWSVSIMLSTHKFYIPILFTALRVYECDPNNGFLHTSNFSCEGTVHIIVALYVTVLLPAYLIILLLGTHLRRCKLSVDYR